MMRSVVVVVALLACAVMAEQAVNAHAKVEVQTKICGNYCGPSKFECSVVILSRQTFYR